MESVKFSKFFISGVGRWYSGIVKFGPSIVVMK